MKILASIILQLILFNPIFAQTLIAKIVDINDNPLSGKLLIKDSIYASTIREFTTFKNGFIHYTISGSYKNFTAVFVATGYQTFSKEIKVLDSSSSFKLQIILDKNQKINTLEEVIINTERKFNIKRDTLVYNVSSYLEGDERKVEDLLKKLLGIRVDEDTGKVLYRGKQVKTVMLDGDNLFGYNYTLGTKNINIDAVHKIEAIENYIDNPLLKNIKESNDVALNLKIKAGKTDFSGTMDISAGVNENAEGVFDSNINGLSVNKKNKSFSTLSYNNIGINRAPKNYLNNELNASDLANQNSLTMQVIPNKTRPIYLKSNRENINNEFFLIIQAY